MNYSKIFLFGVLLACILELSLGFKQLSEEEEKILKKPFSIEEQNFWIRVKERLNEQTVPPKNVVEDIIVNICRFPRFGILCKSTTQR